MSLVTESKNNNFPILFTSETFKDTYQLTLDQIHHLRVRRELQTSQTIYLSDQNSLSKGHIEVKTSKKVFLDIEKQELLEPRSKSITLLACPIKNDMNQLVIQKAVELGVDRIIPLISEYTQGKDHKKKYPSLQKTIELACSQSRQVQCPDLQDPIKIADLDACDIKSFIVSDWKTSNRNFPKTLEPASVGLLVGPEGGWSEHDHQILNNYPSICLSNNVLRAETAAILFCGMTIAYIEQL